MTPFLTALLIAVVVALVGALAAPRRHKAAAAVAGFGFGLVVAQLVFLVLEAV